MIALKREAEKGTRTKKLQRIADKLVDLAVEGNITAIKEIADRVEGRPTQTIAGDSDKPHELVIRVIDPTKPRENQ